ncbi:MAG: low molecular weight protein arginine phosphatase [Deltaproteobacteria bacterium]
MTRILLVCTGNTCRSPMAEALFLKLLQDNADELQKEIEICSAGLYTLNDLPASPEAIMIMEREGLDITRHRSKVLDVSMIYHADLILTMGSSHRDEIRERFPETGSRVYTLGEYAGFEGLDINDPIGGGIEAYQKCASQLKEILPRVWYNIQQGQVIRRKP